MDARTIGLAQVRTWASANWFLLVWPLLLSVEWIFSRSEARAEPRLFEAVILFDMCVVVPLLYVLCYRRKLGARALALRALGLACSGIFIASWLVPVPMQTLLPYLSWPRMVGIAAVLLIEIKLVVEVTGLVYSGRGSVQDIADRTGTPPALIKLMALEARFWNALWRFVRRR